MAFVQKTFENVEVITLSGRFDTENSEAVEKEFDSLDQSGSLRSLIDMSDVNYISSSMIRVMIKTLKAHRARGGDIQLVGLQPNILKVLEMTGIDTIFKIHEQLEDGVASFSEPSSGLGLPL